ncbi:hypothetical protein ACWEKT_06365 [Nocardia takedensis]
MGNTVRRLLVRGGLAAALGLGSLIALGPQAVAEGCPAGTARVFFSNSTNTCQPAGSATYANPWASRVCTTSGTRVVIDTTGKRKANKRHIELEPAGFCAQLDLDGQQSATIQVLPE